MGKIPPWPRTWCSHSTKLNSKQGKSHQSPAPDTLQNFKSGCPIQLAVKCTTVKSPVVPCMQQKQLFQFHHQHFFHIYIFQVRESTSEYYLRNLQMTSGSSCKRLLNTHFSERDIVSKDVSKEVFITLHYITLHCITAFRNDLLQ